MAPESKARQTRACHASGPRGSSSMESIRRAQSAAQTIVAGLKERSKPTSTGNISRRPRKSARDPDQIPVADVLALYGSDVVPAHARPHETAQRIERLLAFFGGKMLCAVDGDLCRAYVSSRSTDAAARRDLKNAGSDQPSSPARADVRKSSA